MDTGAFIRTIFCYKCVRFNADRVGDDRGKHVDQCYLLMKCAVARHSSIKYAMKRARTVRQENSVLPGVIEP